MNALEQHLEVVSSYPLLFLLPCWSRCYNKKFEGTFFLCLLFGRWDLYFLLIPFWCIHFYFIFWFTHEMIFNLFPKNFPNGWVFFYICSRGVYGLTSFLLCSFSCIPLYNFSYVYDYIMSSSTSFVDRWVNYFCYFLKVSPELSLF